MSVSNVGKMLLLGLLTICLTILVGLQTIGFGEAGPIYTLIVGYLVGNGVAAIRDEPNEPVFKSNHHHEAAPTAEKQGGTPHGEKGTGGSSNQEGSTQS